VGGRIQSHQDLVVYQRARDLATRVFEMSKRFPREETYSLTDQIRRSSRSVSSNIAEAWRKRRYEGSFVSKLTDVEAEAAETQVWLEHAELCGYIGPGERAELHEEYERLLGSIVGMIHHAANWTIRPPASDA
jgi:four helix bundle protein